MQKQLDLVRQLDAMQAQLNELQASRATAAALAPAPAPTLPQQRSLEDCPGDELDARLQQLMGEAEELRRVKQRREAAQNQMLELEPGPEPQVQAQGQEPRPEHEQKQQPQPQPSPNLE